VPWTHAGRYGSDDFVFPNGRPIPAGSTVEVFEPDGVTPASVFADRDRAAAANPFTLTTVGNVEFFADPGDYMVSVNGGAPVAVQVYPDIADLSGGGSDGEVVPLRFFLDARRLPDGPVPSLTGFPGLDGQLAVGNIADVNPSFTDTVVDTGAFRAPLTAPQTKSGFFVTGVSVGTAGRVSFGWGGYDAQVPLAADVHHNLSISMPTGDGYILHVVADVGGVFTLGIGVDVIANFPNTFTMLDEVPIPEPITGDRFAMGYLFDAGTVTLTAYRNGVALFTVVDATWTDDTLFTVSSVPLLQDEDHYFGRVEWVALGIDLDFDPDVNGPTATDVARVAEVAGGGAVVSVNGQVGAVVLGAADVGADPVGAAAAAQAAAIASSQPVDADLTAIALLTTTSYGRSLLTLAAASDLRTAAGTTNATMRTGAFYESMSRVEAISAAAQTSGTLYMHSITLQPGQTITSITVLNGNTSLSGHTNHWAGVWDSSRVCLAISPDATNTAWGSNSAKTFTMGTPYANPGATALQLYVGIMVAGVTTGNFISCNAMVSATVSVAPTFCATSTTGMTSPPAVGSTAGALSTATRRPWFWLA